MWRWTALVILAVLYKHISSQPITDDSTNVRPTTHLDLEESCSCEDLEKSAVRRDARYDDSIDAGSEDMFTRSRDFDDCPCRSRDTDSQGASSLLFPTAMRSAGTYMRPGEKKEDPKPLFNPEVDLASSVLEQLRVATDEEYKEALARDAAKSAARADEDIVFEDATPQESANVVTVVVNPKAADSEEVIPLASNIKQSRCIHPVQRISRINLISDVPKFFRKRPYYRNLHDIDSEVGASNIDQQILSFDEKDITNTSPLVINGNNNIKSFKVNTDIDDNCIVPPAFRSSSVQNKLKEFELASSPLLQRIKDKIRPLSRPPKLKLQNLLPEDSKINVDLSAASSVVQEQAIKRVPYIRDNSKLDSIRQQSRPLSITNLLNLKDVELIPLRDLIGTQARKSKFVKSGSIPHSMFEHDDNEYSIKKESKDIEDWKTTRLTLRNNLVEDRISKSKSSSSDVNFEMNPMGASMDSDNCNNVKKSIELNRESLRNDLNKPKNVLPAILEHDDGEFFIESDGHGTDLGTTRFTEVNESVTDNIVDPESSPSLVNVQMACEEMQMSKDSSNSIDKKHGESWTKSTEILETVPVVNDDLSKETFDSPSDCVEDNNDQDSITDASNTITNTIDQLELQSFENESVESHYSKPKSIDWDEETNTMKEPRIKLIDPISIDKTISNLKSFILKKKENLNNIKTSMKSRDISNQNSEDNLVNRNVNEDCVNEASIFITTDKAEILNDDLQVFATPKNNMLDNSMEDTPTTSLPNISTENSEGSCVSAKVSMQDLQKLSDSILQQEEVKSLNIERNEPSNNEKEEPLTTDGEGPKHFDSDSSTSTQTEAIVEPKNVQERSDEIKTCKTDLPLEKDANVQASEIIINTIPKASEIHEIQSALKPTTGMLKNPIKDIRDILNVSPIDPSHAIDNIKDKFTKLFDKHERDTGHTFSSALQPEPDTVDILDSLKTTDISSSNFPLRKPIFRLTEGHNSDKLEEILKPSLLLDIENYKPQSYKSESLLSKGLQFQPFNAKSSLEENNDNKNYLKSTTKLFDERDHLNELRSKIADSSVEASKNNYSSLRNSQNVAESKLRPFKYNNMDLLKTPIKSSTSLLDTLSQNHEDMNNKLRALHMDFNDRVESLRNDLFDSSKLLTSRYRSTKTNLKSPITFNKKGYGSFNDKLKSLHMDFNDRIESMRNDIIDKSHLLTGGLQGKSKPNFRSSSNSNKQNKLNIPLKKTWQASNRREPKLLSTKKQTPLKIRSSPKTLDHQKLRMPAAASVPVPRTVQVPELKKTLSKLPPTLRTISRLTPSTNRMENEDLSRNLGRQASSLKLPDTLKNKINLKKDNKIKVSFSTTPRPESSMPQKIAKGKENFESRQNYGDRIVSPSEVQKFRPSVFNYDELSNFRYLNKEKDDELLSKSSGLKDNSHLSEPKTALQSWPKATESAFLSKVKEAVRERLSNMNSAKALRQFNTQTGKAEEMRELSRFNSDMARSASENKEIMNDATLKENIPYKCNMVCTKD